jgi:hypothetical protein
MIITFRGSIKKCHTNLITKPSVINISIPQVLPIILKLRKFQKKKLNIKNPLNNIKQTPMNNPISLEPLRIVFPRLALYSKSLVYKTKIILHILHKEVSYFFQYSLFLFYFQFSKGVFVKEAKSLHN